MSVEGLKSLFDIAAVVLLFLTFAAGAGVLITGNIINKRQEEKLHQFDAGLTGAKTELAKQQKRAADAEANIKLAEQHAAEASAKAEEFRLDIAKANASSDLAKAQVATATAEAAKATERAAEAQLELARFKAPRTLSLSQQETIAAGLRPFGTKRVDVIIIGDIPEIANICGNIESAMTRAGWFVNHVGKAVSGPNVAGVFVGTHTGVDSDTALAAENLMKLLNLMGIQTIRALPQYNDEIPMALIGTWDKKNVAPIRVYVSAKP